MNSKKGVPSPWNSVAVNENADGCSVNVWGRKYEIKDNLLFSSISSLGDELLNSPMRISASENGKAISWNDTEVFLAESNDDKAIIYATSQSEVFIVNTATVIEFDGLATVDIKLMPQGFTVPQLFGLNEKNPPLTKLDYFHIEIPIKKKYAELYHLYPSNIMPDATGNTDSSDMYSGTGFTPEKDIGIPFSAVTFLGNDDKGFFTFAESDKNWQPNSANEAIQFIVREDEVVIRLRLIDGNPHIWDEINAPHGQYSLPDISFRLAFQATPVKPFPSNPYTEKRLHIDCFKKISLDYDDFLANPVMSESDEIGYDRIKRLGVTTLILHEKWNQVQNYWKLTKCTERRLRTIIEECHKRGIKVVPYFGYEISTLADIWYDKAEKYSRKGSEMNKGLGWYRFPAQREHPVCYNSSIADEFTAGIEKLVDDFGFDGIYLDGTGMVWDCKNTAHGCGYYDEKGNLKPTYPIFGVRRLLKNLYNIFEKRGKTINCHVSDCICTAGISFAHALWLGEYIQYSLVKFGADEMPEGYLRSTHNGRNIGIPTEFIVYENKPVWSFDNALAFSLVNGVLPRPNDIEKPLEKMSEIWKIIDNFPISDSQWNPYYKPEKMPFKCDSGQVKISGYRYSKDGKNKWLLFIANSKTSDIKKCEISGFDGFKTVSDAYTDERLLVNKGFITLNLKSFGHYIIVAV